MTNKERYAGKKQMTAFVSQEIIATLKKMAADKGMYFSRFIEQVLEQFVKEIKHDN